MWKTYFNIFLFCLNLPTVGESERALASLFHRARMASPCVIFFDEIDAIGSKRGQGDGSTGGDRLLSQLLTELDGVSTSSGNIMIHDDPKSNKIQTRVVVVGATNRPDLLDSALIRPGRIDRMIYVGLPDEISRADIFRIALKNKACAADVDVRICCTVFVPFFTIAIYILTSYVDSL